MHNSVHSLILVASARTAVCNWWLLAVYSNYTPCGRVDCYGISQTVSTTSDESLSSIKERSSAGEQFFPRNWSHGTVTSRP